VEVYSGVGSLFLGAVGQLEGLGERVPAGTRVVILEAQHLVSIDASGLDALEQLLRDIDRRGMRLLICGLHRQPLALLGGVAAGLQPDLPLLWPDLPAAMAAAATFEPPRSSPNLMTD
jgi:SulP family sulfate permease